MSEESIEEKSNMGADAAEVINRLQGEADVAREAQREAKARVADLEGQLKVALTKIRAAKANGYVTKSAVSDEVEGE